MGFGGLGVFGEACHGDSGNRQSHGDCPLLIGQVPLELLDFVVDPVGQKLIGNPDHGGEQMIDLL